MKHVVTEENVEEQSVQWAQFLGVSLALSVFLGLGIGVIFYLVAGTWSITAMGAGFTLVVARILVLIRNGLKTVAEQPAHSE